MSPKFQVLVQLSNKQSWEWQTEISHYPIGSNVFNAYSSLKRFYLTLGACLPSAFLFVHAGEFHISIFLGYLII